MADIEDDTASEAHDVALQPTLLWEAGVVTFTPSNSTLVTVRSTANGSRYELYEHTSGRYFMRVIEAKDERIRLVPPSEALKTIIDETRHRVSQLAKEKAKGRFAAVFRGLRYESDKATPLGVVSADDGEAAAAYRAINGQVFIRIVSRSQDDVLFVRNADVSRMEEALNAWLSPERRFTAVAESLFALKNVTRTAPIVDGRY
jgi:hypothetical protein